MPPESPSIQWSFLGTETAPRLDKLLKQFYPWISRQNIKRWFDRRAIRINGRIASKSSPLYPKDVVEIADITPFEERIPTGNPDLELRVLHLDEDIIAIEKESHWHTHPITPWENETAVHAILSKFPEIESVGKERRAPGLIHRLDLGTSGVLVFARNDRSYEFLKASLAQKVWKKEYLCWVYGNFSSQKIIKDEIAHHPKSSKRMCLAKNFPKESKQEAYTIASSLWENEKEKESLLCSPLYVEIKTGVRHQIRIHLASLSHPLIGDNLYQQKSEEERCEDPLLGELEKEGRLLLHSWKTTLPSMQKRSEPITIISPPPFYFPL